MRPVLSRVCTFVERHPDFIALGFALAAGLAMRMAFTFRTPVLLTHDSVAYFQAGYDFARGSGFELAFKRTPIYPIFIAGVVSLLGEDLQAVPFVQHLLGLIAVALTYLLARTLFGRLAALVAALLVALSGPLIIYEHYLLAETVFIVLLLTAMLTLAVGIRQERFRWLALAGLLLGIAGLTRPVGQAVLFAAPPALLVGYGSWRKAALGSLVVALGAATVILPWMARNALSQGAFDSSGLLGQTLVGRITRHDEGFVLPSPESPAPYTDPVKTEARGLILRQMAREARPSALNHRLRSTFGWTEAQASSAMKDVALEILLVQRDYYLASTFTKWRRLLWGDAEDFLGYHYATRKSAELRESWVSNASIAHLLEPPTPIQEAEKLNARAIVGLFSPWALRWPLFLLLLAGLAVGLRGPHRWAVVYIVALTLALTIPAAALVGFVPRYRYPADPFLAILVGAGVLGLVGAVRCGLNWAASRRTAGSAARTPATAPAERPAAEPST